MAEIFDFGFQKYRLKLSGVYNQSGLFAVVGDTARRVEVQLLDAAGRVTDTTGIELSLSTAVGQSSSYVDANLIDASKGLYQVDLTNGLFLKPGKQDFQWTIYKDGKQINSVISRWHIDKSVSEGGNQSFNFYLNADDLKSMQQDFIDDTVKSEALRASVEERYSNLEADYAQDLSKLKKNDADFTAQLAQTEQRKADRKEVRFKSEMIGLDDATPQLLEAIAGGEGTSFDIKSIPRPKSVTPYSSTFIENSTNLFDQSNMEVGNVSLATGEDISSTTYSRTIKPIVVEPSQPYTFIKFIRIIQYDINGNHIKGEEFNAGYGTTGQTITMEDNTHFIGLATNINYLEGQINKGSELLPFEPYRHALRGISVPQESIEIVDNSITKEKVDFIDISTNLFDKERVVENAVISSIDGSLNEPQNPNHITSDWIKVESLTNYTMYGFLYYAFYDKNKNFIKSLDNSIVASPHTFETGIYTHYIRVTVRTDFSNVDYNKLQINEGKTLLPYEPYYVRLSNELVNVGSGLNNITVAVPFEPSGLDMNSGMVTNATQRDYETTIRTGKFLEVLPTSTVNFEYDVGAGYIFEYDKDFRFMEHKSVLSGANYSLSPSTAYVKLMVDGLTNGQYVTGKFNYLGSERTPKWVYNNRVNGDYINFTYEVNDTGGRQVLDDDATIINHNPNKYYNSGLLKLPPNYDPFGEPVRLIIFNGGANSFLNFEDQNIGYDNHLQYWVDEGYALLAVHDWTTKYEGDGVNFGSPITVQARVQAYNWVINNFNIARNGVMLSGYSAGGYKAFNLLHDKGLPVLGAGILAPGISPISQGRMFGYTYENRLDYADDFGFEGDFSVLESSPVSTAPFTGAKREFLIQNLDKIIGYNPFWNGIVGTPHSTLIEQLVDNEEYNYDLYKDMYRVSDVPLKIWIAKDDANTPYVMSEIYVKTIRNANGIAELRTMPNGTGGHWAVSTDPNALKVDSITTRLGIEHTNVPLAFAEVIQFFRRYDK